MMEDIFREIEKLKKELDRAFERLSSMRLGEMKRIGRELEWMREPLIDLRETKDAFIATIELPGIEKKNIELNITESSFEIKVEKKKEEKIEKENYLREERAYKGFYRKMSLPSAIIPEKAKATYKDGILEITMPKAEKKMIKSMKVKVE